jgi:hypothetical protein
MDWKIMWKRKECFVSFQEKAVMQEKPAEAGFSRMHKSPVRTAQSGFQTDLN